MTGFIEFGVASNFTFLRGASHPEELMAQAIALGLDGIGLADRNSVAGVVRAHVYLRENREQAKGFRYFCGARLVFGDGTPDMLAYPQDRAAWGRLTRLLTRGNLRAQKGSCLLRFEDVLDFCEGLRFAVMPATSHEAPEVIEEAETSRRILALAKAARGRVWLAASMLYGVHMRRDLAARVAL